ncbi:helix-turn-helix domain-containing protein [Puia dinghuensis]|uniref:AraC family transcriptional regulator n=1 Tax=Puia dinghuensis TaxID=1792502 RepID=A0A8J2UDF8_9BACT|nr:response regulator transcription factor [Puia dinghuensis]GGB02098.1 AraC family transcriptional regulator [Puia dinghuensis]
MNKVHRIRSITEYHRVRGLSKPAHPLISLIDYAEIKNSPENNDINWVFDFYSIALKRNCGAKFKYGQQEYDFDEGILFFMSPGQVLRIEVDDANAADKAGLGLLIHPDFLWNTSLAGNIKKYEYFGYAVHEALFLSDKEEQTVLGVLENIRQEIHSNIDKFSQNIIISHIEALLNYADRFYHRQFITRKISNHQVLERLDKVLDDYFESDDLINKGLLSVQRISEALNISANYLSVLLRTLTGQSTQQHIHEKLIAKAKEKLSTTTLSVSEIAYELGFEHSQSFSKLFKAKTKMSPLEFRSGFN